MQFGTDLIFVRPGRTTTTGIPGAMGATVRKLTVEEGEALLRVAGVEKVLPVVVGNARVEAGGRGRSVFVVGVTADFPRVLKVGVRQGTFLPASDPRRGAPVTVLGPSLKREIFGEANALGEHVRIGGQRFLVIGVMAPVGVLLGIDVDDRAYIPVATAQRVFNRDELTELHLQFTTGMGVDRVVGGVTKALQARHGGEEDFTIVSQTDMLAVFDRVLGIVSIGVGAIGGISLVVGAIGILTMMWISVNERTAEIGLRPRRHPQPAPPPLPPGGVAPLAGGRGARGRGRDGGRGLSLVSSFKEAAATLTYQVPPLDIAGAGLDTDGLDATTRELLPLDLEELRRKLDAYADGGSKEEKIYSLNLDYMAKNFDPGQVERLLTAPAAERRRMPALDFLRAKVHLLGNDALRKRLTEARLQMIGYGKSGDKRELAPGQALRVGPYGFVVQDLARGGRKDAKLLLQYDRVPSLLGLKAFLPARFQRFFRLRRSSQRVVS